MDWPGSGPAPVVRETTAGLAVGSLLVARGEDCRMARGLSTTSSPLCCRTRADFSGSGPGRPQSASARLPRFFSTAASGSVEGDGCPAEELDSAAAGFLLGAYSAAASGSAAGAGRRRGCGSWSGCGAGPGSSEGGRQGAGWPGGGGWLCRGGFAGGGPLSCSFGGGGPLAGSSVGGCCPGRGELLGGGPSVS